jgi:hypothetical protein
MPNQFLDIRGLEERQKGLTRDAASQGMKFGQNHIGAKTLFGPMMIMDGSGAGSWLPARPGIRYFIHSIALAGTKAVTDTGTRLYVTSYFAGTSRNMLNLWGQTLTAESMHAESIIDALTDENRAVAFNLTGTWTSSTIVIAYQEVTQENG